MKFKKREKLLGQIICLRLFKKRIYFLFYFKLKTFGQLGVDECVEFW